MLVEETGISGALEMFELRSAGPGRRRFAVNNTSAEGGAGAKWAFDVQFSGDYALSRAGTGVNEVLIDGSDNMSIEGTLTQNSGRTAKQSITEEDSQAILAKVLALPLAHWRYRKDRTGALHLGPMAEDFDTAFGLGKDEQGISTIDTSDAALAAIQGLQAEYDRRISQLRNEKDTEIDALCKGLAELRALLQRQSAAGRPVASADAYSVQPKP